MTDVFLSYASENRSEAEQVAHALEAAGFSVWWDREIIIGETFDKAIERELEAARCVVVLWSSHSVASEWVRNEAAAAAERGVLMPAMIEPVKLPIEFRRKQTADMSDWNADAGHPGFQALLRGIATATNRKPLPPQQPENIPRPPPKRGNRTVLLLVLALLVGGLMLYAWMALQDGPNPEDMAEPAQAVEAVPAAAVDSDTGNNVAASSRVPVTDLVAGTYYGGVVADSTGGSRNGVSVTLTKIDAWTVRVTSDYARIKPIEITIDRIENTVVQAGGDTAFYLSLDKDPVQLQYSPGGEYNYVGIRVDE